MPKGQNRKILKGLLQNSATASFQIIRNNILKNGKSTANFQEAQCKIMEKIVAFLTTAC